MSATNTAPGYEAYLVISFQVVKGFPRFRGVGIYSESANNLTLTGSGVVNADLLSMSGNTYAEARAKVVEYVNTAPWMEWARPWVDGNYGDLQRLLPFLKRL